MPEKLQPFLGEPLTLALTAVIVGLAFALWVLNRRLAHMQGRIEELAESQFLAWRDREIGDVKAQMAALAEGEALVKLEHWRLKSESGIRQDAVARSQAVVLGKVTEHLAPYMPDFPYNPRDARFIGSPIDIVVFDGADEGYIREVILMEVKTNTSGLNARQRQIRDAVAEGRISWQEIRIDTPVT